MIFAEWTGKSSSLVLFSGQSALPSLLENSATFSVGALILLVVCKGLAYGVSLSSFRGGPTFPGMFIGAAGGIALSHLPGLPMVAGAAMGIGAMTCAMLNLPLTSVLLTTLFLASDGLTVMPLVIVAVVVAYVARARFSPPAPGCASPRDRSRTVRRGCHRAVDPGHLHRGHLHPGHLNIRGVHPLWVTPRFAINLDIAVTRVRPSCKWRGVNCRSTYGKEPTYEQSQGRAGGVEGADHGVAQQSGIER